MQIIIYSIFCKSVAYEFKSHLLLFNKTIIHTFYGRKSKQKIHPNVHPDGFF